MGTSVNIRNVKQTEGVKVPARGGAQEEGQIGQVEVGRLDMFRDSAARLRSLARSLAASHSGAPQQLGSNSDWQSFDRAFEEAYINTRGFALGCTVVVMDADGIKHRRVFGTDREDQIYCFFSTTKLVTTIACLQLRDRGLLSLDDPVSKHLASFQCSRPLDDGSDDSHTSTSTITIRHCLNHTSGLSYYWMDPPHITSPAEKVWGHRMLSEDLNCGLDNSEVVDDFWSRCPSLFEPGEHYNYAGGHCVVAAIIEKLSGLSLPAYLETHIFGPLGMHDTTYLLTPEQRERLHPRCPLETAALPMSLFSRLFVPTFTDDAHDIHTQPTHARGDSGLKGTANDWARLNLMLLNHGALDGKRILSKESVLELSTSSVNGRLLEPPFAFQRGVTDPRYTQPPTSPAFRVAEEDQFELRPFNHFPGHSVGLGVLVVEDAQRATVVPSAKGMCWWCGYASTYFGFNPTSGIGILLLGHQFPTTQTRTSAFRDVINAAHTILQRESSPPPPAEAKPSTPPPREAAADTLRTLFALCVIAYHCTFFFTLGREKLLDDTAFHTLQTSRFYNPMIASGVEAPNVFFMLSGFFTTKSLLLTLRSSSSHIDTRKRIVARFLRLWPLVAVPTLLGLLIDPAFYDPQSITYPHLPKVLGHLSLLATSARFTPNKTQWRIMFSTATSPVWSIMVDLHVTSSILLVP